MNTTVRLVTIAVALTAVRSAGAGELTVPPATQVEMLAKLIQFDRGFHSRAGDAAHLLVLEASGRADSHRAAQQLKAALESLGTFGGLGLTIELETFTTGAELTGHCLKSKPAAIYLAPGFTSREVEDMARAVTNIAVLTVASAGADVAAGAVVGFDLVEGKPRILVNLPQAEKQGVSFSSAFLSLAKVIR